MVAAFLQISSGARVVDACRRARCSPIAAMSSLPPLAMHRAAAARQGLPAGNTAVSQPVDFLQRLEAVEKKDTTTSTELWPAVPAAAQAPAPSDARFGQGGHREHKKKNNPRGNLDADADNMEALVSEIQNDIARARKRNSTPPEKHAGGSLEL